MNLLQAAENLQKIQESTRKIAHLWEYVCCVLAEDMRERVESHEIAPPAFIEGENRSWTIALSLDEPSGQWTIFISPGSLLKIRDDRSLILSQIQVKLNLDGFMIGIQFLYRNRHYSSSKAGSGEMVAAQMYHGFSEIPLELQETIVEDMEIYFHMLGLRSPSVSSYLRFLTKE